MADPQLSMSEALSASVVDTKIAKLRLASIATWTTERKLCHPAYFLFMWCYVPEQFLWPVYHPVFHVLQTAQLAA